MMNGGGCNAKCSVSDAFAQFTKNRYHIKDQEAKDVGIDPYMSLSSIESGKDPS